MSDSEVIVAAEKHGFGLVVEMCDGELSWGWVPPGDGGDRARWATHEEAIAYMRAELAGARRRKA